MSNNSIPVRLFDRIYGRIKDEGPQTPGRLLHQNIYPRNVDSIYASESFKIVESNGNSCFKARSSLGGACLSLQSLPGSCKLFAASRHDVEEKTTALAIHRSAAALCNKRLPELSQGFSHSLQPLCRRATLCIL